ncbi:MAG: hypothetical protein D6812_00690, partial [Deltaproteobacteria bacterium]
LKEAINALQRENKEVIYGSMIKETILKKRPSFDEQNYGYKSFGKFLLEAQRRGLIHIKREGGKNFQVELLDDTEGEETTAQASPLETPYELLANAILSQEGPKDVMHPMEEIRAEILRRNADFSERSTGYKSFKEFLEGAQQNGVVTLYRDPNNRGGYLVGISREYESRLRNLRRQQEAMERRQKSERSGNEEGQRRSAAGRETPLQIPSPTSTLSAKPTTPKPEPATKERSRNRRSRSRRGRGTTRGTETPQSKGEEPTPQGTVTETETTAHSAKTEGPQRKAASPTDPPREREKPLLDRGETDPSGMEAGKEEPTPKGRSTDRVKGADAALQEHSDASPASGSSASRPETQRQEPQVQRPKSRKEKGQERGKPRGEHRQAPEREEPRERRRESATQTAAADHGTDLPPSKSETPSAPSTQETPAPRSRFYAVIAKEKKRSLVPQVGTPEGKEEDALEEKTDLPSSRKPPARAKVSPNYSAFFKSQGLVLIPPSLRKAALRMLAELYQEATGPFAESGANVKAISERLTQQMKETGRPVTLRDIQALVNALSLSGCLLGKSGKPSRSNSHPVWFRMKPEEAMAQLDRFYLWSAVDCNGALEDREGLCRLILGPGSRKKRLEDIVEELVKAKKLTPSSDGDSTTFERTAKLFYT